jgi:DNA polymerase-1
MLLQRGLSKKVKELGLWDIYEMERQLVWTTLAIEARGMYLDRKRAEKLIEWMETEATKALEEFQAIVGKRVPLNANTVRRVLYDQMGLPVLKETEKGLPSVDKYVLKDLHQRTGYPIFDPILRYRSYSRTKIIQGYIDLADSNGIIHPNIHPYKADTSRQACTRPNLHNVEREDRLVNPYPIPARTCFGPEPGHVNYHLDYEGIQMREAAHYSQDPELLRIIREGLDPHDEGAKEFYGERYTSLASGPKKKMMRDAAKNGDFNNLFAGGMASLAKCLGLKESEVRPGYRRWKRRFPELAELNRNDSRQVRENGFVTTAYGRILRVPRNKAYIGTNWNIQGGEAGLLKRKEIEVDDYLTRATGDEVGIILSLHDELVIKCPRERIQEFEGECLPHIRELMIDAPEFSVPLEIEAKVSIRDWAHKKKVRIRGTERRVA